MPHPRVRVTARQLGDRHFFIALNAKVGIVTQSLLRAGKNGRKAKVKAGYFGFSTHSEAIVFANSVRSRFPKARLEVRQAKRLNTTFEVKVSHDCVEQLAWDFLWNHQTVSDAIAQQNAFYANRAAGIAHHASQFVDRSSTPLQGRSRPQLARCGDRMISIE
jgi:hypothetical protein